MDSIENGRPQKSNAGLNKPVENKGTTCKHAQETKNQQLSSTALKQLKKTQKQLVGENMERMNYLYQCASLVAKLTSVGPKLASSEFNASLTSSANESPKRDALFCKNRSPERISSVSIRTVLPGGVTPSSESKESTFGTSSQRSSSTICSVSIQPPSEAEISSLNSAVSCLVQPSQCLVFASKGALNTLSSEESTVSTASPRRSESRGGVLFLHPEIASNLGSTCRAIGRKCQLRMSHILKKEMCPSCYTHLVPTVTASAKIIRVRKKRVLVLTCHTCGRRRKRPCQDVKTLWTEKPESLLIPKC
ncbi:RNAse P Rpr2/Rpp21 subunit [Trinorchestia longiramus]|nr:RNAse P Rpr2/Rpp21 subunit [Trinorchestia longiramus]